MIECHFFTGLKFADLEAKAGRVSNITSGLNSIESIMSEKYDYNRIVEEGLRHYSDRSSPKFEENTFEVRRLAHRAAKISIDELYAELKKCGIMDYADNKATFQSSFLNICHIHMRTLFADVPKREIDNGPILELPTTSNGGRSVSTNQISDAEISSMLDEGASNRRRNVKCMRTIYNNNNNNNNSSSSDGDIDDDGDSSSSNIYDGGNNTDSNSAVTYNKHDMEEDTDNDSDDNEENIEEDDTDVEVVKEEQKQEDSDGEVEVIDIDDTTDNPNDSDDGDGDSEGSDGESDEEMPCQVPQYYYPDPVQQIIDLENFNVDVESDLEGEEEEEEEEGMQY